MYICGPARLPIVYTDVHAFQLARELFCKLLSNDFSMNMLTCLGSEIPQGHLEGLIMVLSLDINPLRSVQLFLFTACLV